MTPTPTLVPVPAPTPLPTHALAVEHMRYIFIGAAFAVMLAAVVYAWGRGARMDRKVLASGLGDALEDESDGDDDGEADGGGAKRVKVVHADESHGSPRTSPRTGAHLPRLGSAGE